MLLIDGIHVPLTAPFYRDGRLYLRKLEHNVARYSLTPAAALVAFAPGGESSSLSDAEVSESLVAISTLAANEKLLIAGVTRPSVAQCLTLAAEAYEAKFDAVLLSAPPTWPEIVRQGGHDELLGFFRTVADNSPLPVLLWSDSSTPSLGLSVETVAGLATHPNIVGLYDADLTPERLVELKAATASVSHEAVVTTTFRPVPRRMLHVEATGPATFVSADLLSSGGASIAVAPPAPPLKTRTKKLGFQIMHAGAANAMVEMLHAGASGTMPLLAAAAPQGCHEALAAFGDGDPALAALKASRLIAADAIIAELGPAGLKYGCDLNGYYGGSPRLPRLPLHEANRKRVEEALRELRN